MGYQYSYSQDIFCDRVASYMAKYNLRYQRHYSSQYRGDKLIRKAKLHSIYHYVLNLTGARSKKKTVFLIQLHEQLCGMQVGIPRTYNYFTGQLKKMRNEPIEDVLLHKSKGTKREDRRKFVTVLVDYSEVLYHENLWSYRQILHKVNRCARRMRIKEISESTLKAYFGKNEVQNRLRLLRNGDEWYFDNIGRKSHFTKPKYSGQLIEIDGSRFQIPFNNIEEEKIDWLSLFAIIDVTSSKILGYALGKSETSKLVKNAFKRLLNFYNFLPIQIIRDNSSAYQAEFAFFEEYSTFKGVTWIHTSNPTGKPHIEGFFKTFAKTICSFNKLYIGLGITTRDIDSRYTKKQIMERVGNKRELLPLEKDLIEDADILIERFNTTKFDRSLTPNEEFARNYNEEKLISINKPEKSLLIEDRSILTIRNSEITIQYLRKKYYFQFDEELGRKYHQEEVIVAYDKSELSQIHVFNLDFNFLLSISKYEEVPFLLSDRTKDENVRVLKELALRKKNIRLIKQELREKKSRNNIETNGVVNFEIVHNNLSKSKQLKAQNDFTRHLFELDENLESSLISQNEDNIRVIKIDKNRHKRIL